MTKVVEVAIVHIHFLLQRIEIQLIVDIRAADTGHFSKLTIFGHVSWPFEKVPEIADISVISFQTLKLFSLYGTTVSKGSTNLEISCPQTVMNKNKAKTK